MIYLYYWLIVMLGAISWKPLIPNYGGTILTLVKGALLITIIFIIISRGINKNFLTYFSLCGIFVLFFYLLLQISRLDSVEFANLGDIFKSFSSYLLLFLMLMIRLRNEEIKRILDLIQKLPIFSVVFGLFFSLFTDWSVIKFEFTGVNRLQGSNPPAHLAEICFVAIITSVGLLLKKDIQKTLYSSSTNKLYCYLLINTLILILTFTRITLLGAGLIILYMLIKKLYITIINNRYSIPIVFITIISIFPAIFIFIYMVKSILRRSTNEGGGINTSGRYWAWKYFIDRANEYPVFGRGMGASQSLYDVNPYKEFVAPHNEYIRSYLEVGILGSIIMIIFILVFIGWLIYSNKSNKLLSNKFIFISIISIGIVSYYDNLFVTIHFSLPFILLILCLVNVFTFRKSQEGDFT
ncbi:Lipid A core - O-antigen ligase and related enzymes [Niallia circulans]|nr:Lipid A core - O-antigen ligase and related enzymes [Niallia circulans]